MLQQQNQTSKTPVTEQYAGLIDDGLLSGFMHHPPAFPLSYKRIWFSRESYSENMKQKAIGLCFESAKYLKPGVKIEVSILVRGQTQHVRGQVVLVQAMHDRFKIGMWLTQPADVMRAHAVEQMCHIETYLLTKKHQDGPFLSKERIAEEWLKKYSATFPVAS